MAQQRITNPTPARKERSSMSVAIAGTSGSGKTKTALEIATGLAGPDGRIVVVDTEGRRALHYARHYKFDHVDFRPPYTPERCTQAIAELQRDRYDVVVFDSASDEYEGEGGMIEIAGPGNDWIKAKAQHKHNLIRHLRGTAGTVIFCLRAEEKVKVEKVNGKQVFTPQGWMPICEKRFMYDMTLSFTLSPETPGMPRFDLPKKINQDFLPYFPDKKLIDRAVGEKLRAWAFDVDAPAHQSGSQSQSGQAPATASPIVFKWVASDGNAITFKSADEWATKVAANIAKVEEARLQEALNRNHAELAKHMEGEAKEQALAIYTAFSNRGIYPPSRTSEAA